MSELATISVMQPGGRPDMRRKIVEGEGTPGADYVRSTVIAVTTQLYDDTVELGNHSHPDVENFTVVAGRGTLYLAPKGDPTAIEVTEFSAGQFITIPADVVHTFVCRVGTVLVATTLWPFSEDMIVPCKLDIPRAA